MSDEIVFDVLCTKVLDALRALGLGKFSIRNYYYEGMWPIIKVYRSEGVIFYSAAFTNEIVNRFHLDHENGLVADRIWAKVRKASILFEEYVQTGKIVWKRVRPDPKISLAPYYHELLRRFCQHEANTRAIGFESLRDEENVCRKFFAYLDASGCHTCQDINLVNVNAFLLFIASQRKSSMDRVCNTLKHLSAYLVSIQNCCDFSAALTTRPAPRKKLRPAFSAKEVHTVVDAAAKNPSLSLRDSVGEQAYLLPLQLTKKSGRHIPYIYSKEDKSMAAMIQNDEEKAWMLPMLEFRNEIAGYGDWQTDRDRRDFRKRDGRLQWHNNRLVHGPYTKETREYFLRRLLEVELLVHEIGPDEIKDVPLITMEELKFIRQLWLDEFHEFDDSLPRIYEEVTGKKYSDGTISKNKYFGATEAELLKEVCAELYPNEQLLAEMQRALLDTEAKAAAISNKRNVILNFEKEIKKAFYKDEADAESIASTRALRISGITDEANPDDLVD